MTSEVVLKVDSPLTEPDNNNCNGIQAKKRRMGNELMDLLNDSGIPMDGIELDSSSSNSHNNHSSSSSSNHHNNHHQQHHQSINQVQQQLASTTNSTTKTISNSGGGTSSGGSSSSHRGASSNNEALASNSPALSINEESKCSEHLSLDNNQAASEGHYNASADAFFLHQDDRGNQARNYIRSFGDLFDDDDLD